MPPSLIVLRLLLTPGDVISGMFKLFLVFFSCFHSSLVITALFDREVNCRRAASVSHFFLFQVPLSTECSFENVNL